MPEKHTAAYQMIDVGDKQATFRQAVATGYITLSPHVFKQVVERRLPKGDALILAEIAGIQAAKMTAQLIPLCHPLPIEKIKVWLKPDHSNAAIHAYGLVRTHYKTGVEMEALQAVSGALLTVYDLTKMLDSFLVIHQIKLIYKEGGKNGLWQNQEYVPQWLKPEIEKR